MLSGWYLDSGATHHMTGRRELFSDLYTSVRGSVRFGDTSRVEIQGVGSIVFQAKNGEHRVLQGVYFIPALRNSIMSLGQLDEGGSKVEINHGVLHILDPRGRLLAKVNRGPRRLFVLHLDAAQPICLAARKDNIDWLWHERFGHLNFEALHQLGQHSMARGLPLIKHAEQVSDTCVVTKQRRRTFPQKAENPLELVHDDLCGPVTPATPGGRRYFLLMVDDASRYMWVALLPTKDVAADAVKLIKAEAEKESGHVLKVLHTDNGGEFTVAEFADYCTGKSVRPSTSLQCTSLAAAKQSGRVPQSDCGRHRPCTAEAEEDVGQVLGRSGRDGGASAQPIADQELAGQDPVRDLARACTVGEPPQGLQLRRLRQGHGLAAQA